MNIHFMWAGKGTCCIPLQGTYGPLVSAINVRQGYYHLHSRTDHVTSYYAALHTLVASKKIKIVNDASYFVH